MKLCDCGAPLTSTWGHAPGCPNGPDPRSGCPGLRWCEEIHPYDWHYQCGCEGQCHYCSHMGCEQCVNKAYADQSWWRKLLGWRPGLWGGPHPTALMPRASRSAD